MYVLAIILTTLSFLSVVNLGEGQVTTPAPNACLVTSRFEECSTSDVSVAATCICYSSSAYIGDAVDEAITQCASELTAAGSTSAATIIHSLSGFCGEFAAPSSTVASTTGIASFQSSAGTATITGNPCQALESIYSSCSSATPGFSTVTGSAGALCLCYHNGVWDPDRFDGAISSCATSLQAAGDLSDASTLSSLLTFCSVFTPATVSASTTTTSMSSTSTSSPTTSSTHSPILSVSGSSAAITVHSPDAPITMVLPVVFLLSSFTLML